MFDFRTIGFPNLFQVLAGLRNSPRGPIAFGKELIQFLGVRPCLSGIQIVRPLLPNELTQPFLGFRRESDSTSI